MNGQEFCAALRQGQRVYGTLIASSSPWWPKVVKNLGLDFVFIDTEHVTLDRTTVSWMCQVYGALNLAPIVRIPAPDPYQASMMLDGGACGVIAPYIETVEQVQMMRGAVKLRPLKGQKLQEVLAGQPPEPELASYLAKRNAGSALIINIESTPALEALDDILAVPEIDAILIGPHDLSCSLGIPEQYDQPIFDEAIRTIIRKARARNIGVGIHFSANLEQEIDWAKAGANFIVHSSDVATFAERMRTDISTIKAAVADSITSQVESINI